MKELLTAEDYKREIAELARFPDMNPGPVLRMNFTSEVLLSNIAAQKLFGQDLHHQNWKKICPDVTDTVWKKITSSKGVVPLEVTINEHTFVFHHRTDHKSKHVFAFGTDITQRKLYESELNNHKALIEEMARFPHMNPGPVLRMDQAGKILLSNIAAENLFGRDLYGQNWLNICKEVTSDLWDKILTGDNIHTVESVINNKVFTFSHRCDKESQLVFAFGTDISLQRKAEIQLRQSEKMATLGTLAAGIAHEINNPAAAAKRASDQLIDLTKKLNDYQNDLQKINLSEDEIQLMNELSEKINSKNNKNANSRNEFNIENELEHWLDDHGFDNSWDVAPVLCKANVEINYLNEITQRFNHEHLIIIINLLTTYKLVNELVNEINLCCSDISEIVLALKNYSFLDQAPVLLVNIHDGIENTLVMLKHKLTKGIIIQREYSNNLPKITAFGSELNQAWTNIIDNAIDSLNNNGTITIRTSATNNNVKVEIEDDGPGIPKEIQSKIFDPFFTTKEPGKGTGLGLSTTYGIITEKHNGSINVKSRPGKTVFEIELPVKLN